MLRRLVLCALALCAFTALEGCGVNRVAGPQLEVGDHARSGFPAHQFAGEWRPPRDDTGGGNGETLGGGGGAPGIEADSLGMHVDDLN
jgi:hypothetical protein